MSPLKTSERVFSRELPDVQSTLPDVRINLTRVGVKNVKKLVEVTRVGKRPVIFISNFDIFVDLPGSLKGANLSRNFEVIDEVLQSAIEGEVKEIEQLCSRVARRLLDKHEYADRTEVQMRSEFMVSGETPVSNSTGTMALALTMNVTYVAGAIDGEKIFAEATPVNISRKISVWKIDVRGVHDKLIASCEGVAYHK